VPVPLLELKNPIQAGDMKTAHRGLGITEEDWNIAVKHLIAADKIQK